MTAPATSDKVRQEVEAALAANPYTPYSFVAQNAAVEKDRATRHARTVALALLTRLTEGEKS